MKYFNLFFVLSFFLSFSFLEGVNFSYCKNTISSFSQKKFFQIKNYGKNLKTDMKNFQCSRQGIKQFASLHPWLAAKAGQEVFGFLSMVLLPTFNINVEKNDRPILKKFKSKCKEHFYLLYKDFFNFIFAFNRYSKDNNNYFSSMKVHSKNKGTVFNFLVPFLHAPVLKTITSLFSLSR